MKLRSVMVTALVTVMTLLAACGSGSGSGKNGSSSEPKVDMSFMKDNVDIVFYRPNTGTTEDQFMQIMGNAVKAKFPNVTPKFIPYDKNSTGYNALITSGQDLDLIFYSIGAITDMTDYSLQYDMSPLVKKYNFDVTKLEQTQVDFIKNFSGGGLYGLPIFTTAEILAYNKDLFDKFGVSYPKDGMTWDDLYELAKKLTRVEGGVQYYGYAMSHSHMFQTNQLSLPFLDTKTNKPLIAEDNYRKMVDNFVRFYQIPGGAATKELMSKFSDLWSKDKRLAMYSYFNSTLNMEGNFDSVKLPVFKEAPGVGSQMYPTYLTVSNTSKHKDMAFQILAYMTSDEMQAKFAKDSTGLPVIKTQTVKDQFGQDNPLYKGKNIKSFFPDKPAAIPMKNKYVNIVSGELNKAFTAIVNGEKDSVTALRDAVETSQKAIDTANTK